MAKIITSALISDVYGSVGGVTFSRNSSGLFARARIKPTAKQTASTQTQRSLFSQAIASWQILSDSDKAGWRSFAPVGVTGYQTFISYYCNMRKNDVFTPPIPIVPAVIPSITLSQLYIFTGSSQMSFNLTLTTAGSFNYYIKASAPMSPGRVFDKGNLKAVYVGSTSSDVTIDIFSEYVSVFGFIPPVGTTIWISFEQQSDTAYNVNPPIPTSGTVQL